MRVERRPNSGCNLTLAVILSVAAAAFLLTTVALINLSPRALVALLGLRSMGPLAEVLPEEPPRLTLNGEPLHQLAFVLPPHVSEPLMLTSSDLGRENELQTPLIGSTSVPGKTEYLLTLDENSLNQLLREHGLITGSDDGRYRNVALRIYPGALVIYADVHLGIRQVRAGYLMHQAEDSLAISPAGLVLDGNVYDVTDSGVTSQVLLPRVPELQRALHALRIVGPLPGDAQVRAVRFLDQAVQLQAEATYALSRLEDTGWRLVAPGIELREMDVHGAESLPAERLTIIRLDPGEFQIRVHYDPAKPLPVSTWGEMLDALLLVNAGYFSPESAGGYETVGMLITDGETWGRPLQDYAGMLAVTGEGQASVRWLRHQPYNPGENLSQAVQSFPVLVRPGGIMGFAADADDGAIARRTVVAQDRA
ncbi:MAG: phosphodiester glycosidase family protein, partial [Chloroflexota bacterium]